MGQAIHAVAAAHPTARMARPTAPPPRAMGRRRPGGSVPPVKNGFPVTIAASDAPHQEPVPDSAGLMLHVVARPVSAATFAGRIPPGTRSVSLFLVNGRTAAADAARDESFAFQAELEVWSAVPFVPRPDPRGASGDDSDERIAQTSITPAPPSTRPVTAWPRIGSW